MVMLQRLSETQSAASPLQAQAHRVAKRAEALLTETYDLLSSSVRDVVSQYSRWMGGCDVRAWCEGVM